jgi:hypothetical protein
LGCRIIAAKASINLQKKKKILEAIPSTGRNKKETKIDRNLGFCLYSPWRSLVRTTDWEIEIETITMEPFQDEWVFPDGQEEGGDASQTISENESGWETGEADTTSSEEEDDGQYGDSSTEDAEKNDELIFGNESGVMGDLSGSNLLGDPEDASLAVFPKNIGGVGGIHRPYRDDEYRENDDHDDSSSSEDADQNQELLFGNESGVLEGVSGISLLGDPDDARLAVFPEFFGGGGARRPYRDDEYREFDNVRQEILEAFQDEPNTLASPNEVVASLSSSENAHGGLEPLPEDEYEDSSHERLSLSSSMRVVGAATSRMSRRLGLGLILGILLLLIIGISLGVAVARKKDDDDDSSKKSKTQAPIPIPTPSPIRVPTSNGAPSITLPPFGPRTVIVPVSNDGYVSLGGIILRDVEITQSSTLLVQDGYHHTAALSIIEFDTSSSLPVSFLMEGWLTSAIVSLNVAGADLQDFESTTLYARAYPNDEQLDPQFDINQYGFGGLDFDQGWTPFEVLTLGPFQSKKVNIDITDFFLEQYLPTQDGGEWDNVKILIAHDNSDGRANKGAAVFFYSSEAAKQLRPKLLIQLAPPDQNNSPPPSSSVSPSAGPTVSPAPSISMSPSGMPSVAPSLNPSSSWSPTYNPTISPAPTITSYPICSVCGALALINPKAKVSTSLRGFGHGDSGAKIVTCGFLQGSGLKGEIPPVQCQRYQAQVVDTCCDKLTDGGDAGGLYNICDLCQDSSGTIVNPDDIVTIPLVGDTKTCQQYQIQADAGQIPESICAEIQPYTASACCDLVI